MRYRISVIAALLFAANSLGAQTSTNGVPPPKAPAHQPGVPANTAQAPVEAGKDAPAAGADKTAAAKDAAIRHLMEITQTSKLGENINAYVAGQVRQILSDKYQPDALTKFMDTFNQKLAVAAPPAAVTDAAIPIYARAFSMEDIQALTQFYESPLGQRVVKTLPQVVRDSQETGVAMQEKGAMNVLKAMSGEYPELKPLLNAPGAGAETSPAPERAPGTGAAPQAAPAPSK